MSFEIMLWQFDADGETLDCHDDTGDLLNDLIVFIFESPMLRYNDAKH